MSAQCFARCALSDASIPDMRKMYAAYHLRVIPLQTGS
ncbi:hypothetical protein V1291_004766 [Nitrobacteraceae bacterium AZCC 1564]